MLVSFDLETHLIQRGLLAPPIVCGSTARWCDATKRPIKAQLLTREQAVETARVYLASPKVTIAGANIAYDFGCLANEDPSLLPLIFKAYEENRVHDVQIAQALDAIARGHLFQEPTGGPLLDAKGRHTKRYSLDTCVRLTLGRGDAKIHDFWRMRYAILARVPMADWPEDAIQYPKDDANNTVEVAAVQREGIGTEEPRFLNLGNLQEQCESAFAMHLGAMWGLRVDPERVARLARVVGKLHAGRLETYRAIGFIRENGSENGAAVAKAVAKAYGATGACSRCHGSGFVQKMKEEPCKGEKVKGRFQGCFRGGDMSPGGWCSTCKSTGIIQKAGNLVKCLAKEGGCSGTGYDLDTAPNLPRTDTGEVSCSRDTLAESGDDTLAEYGDDEYEKVRTSYLPSLVAAWARDAVEETKMIERLASGEPAAQVFDRPARPVNLRPNVLVASGRTSYEGVTQLYPRSCPACIARAPEHVLACTCVRPCFIPAPGRVFGSTDYEAGELVAFAQVALDVVGSSEMARIINETKNPGSLHTAFGAKMLGVSFDDMQARVKAKDLQAKNFRQAAKPWNFGALGGMGALKLVLTNRKKNAGTTEGPDGRIYAGIRFCILVGGARECGAEKLTRWKGKDCPPVCRACVELAEHTMKPAWFEQFPEAREYLDWIGSMVGNDGCGELPCFGPVDRTRGGLGFCDGANNGFQARLADAAKLGLRWCTREAYLDSSSPLYQAMVRIPGFFHDELFSEMDEETAHLAGPRVAELMVKALKVFCPDVHGGAETALMRAWYKDAEPVYDATGKLVVWEKKGKS